MLKIFLHDILIFVNEIKQTQFEITRLISFVKTSNCFYSMWEIYCVAGGEEIPDPNRSQRIGTK